MKKLIFMTMLLLMTLAIASATDSLSTLTPTANDPGTQVVQQTGQTGALEKVYKPWFDVEILLSLLTLIFGISFLLIVRQIASKTLSGSQYLQLLTLILVVCAAMFLIAAGYNSNQSAPAFSVLGTIVGYLLGKQSNTATTVESTTAPTGDA